METPEARYDGLVDRVESLYGDGRLREAIDLLEAESGGLEAWTAELAHLSACLYGANGDPDAALGILQDASAAGAWWRPDVLTDDEDLEALQSRPEFQQLVEVSRARAADDPLAPLIDLPTDAPVGVVVALHGAGQRAAHSRRDWAGALEAGYALVCIESSQRMSPMYRSWPDRGRSAQDIARALAVLPPELNGVPLIAAGFSAGGRAALEWALTAYPAKAAGVVLMAPALRDLPEASTGPLSPATILIGQDDELLEVVDKAEDRLNAFGFTLDRIPHLSHAFPADFGARLVRILA
jgi:dienelactone hydrolase